MRLTFTLLLGLICSFAVQAQTLMYSENFETSTLPDSVTMVGTGTSGFSTMLFSQGLRSDSMRITGTGDSVVMTTQAFSTTGNSFVMLYFDHICKIEFFDEGYIEVSNDNGATWIRLTGAQYQGLSQFAIQGNDFTAAAYATDWAAGVYAVPSNAWWKSETFDISLLVGNAASVKVRFVLRDAQPGNTMPDNYAWFIDNIRVMGAFSELNPPVITMVAPIPQDTMYTTDPYLVKATITDFSGIDTAYIAYSVNTGITDTVGMSETTPGNFQGSIPFFGFGRTILYKVVAIDASAAHNTAYDPMTGTRMIYAKYSPGGTVTIGTGTSGSYQYGPVYISNTTYLWSNHISLFTPAEIGYTGALSTISWYKNDALGYITNDAVFRIYLKHTNNSTVPSTAGTFASELVGATMVYESTTQNLPLTVGWMDFVLTNPNAFSYNGTSNLLVMVYWYRPNAATGLVTWQYTAAAGKACTWSSAADPPTGVYGNGSRPNIKMTFVTPSNLTEDAGIAQIVYPTGGVIANSAFNVLAKVKNFGTDTLTQATINWTLDGVLQTPYNWTGSLLQDSISASNNLGSLSLPLGVHEIKIWTVNPNGLPDMNYGNDTMSISFMACASLLAGTYTIGGTNPDFIDFTAAVIALDQCGINAPITFNVAPGVYNEQIVLPRISGASATNQVLFQSASNDSTAVTLTYSATGAGANYLVKLDSTQYVTFKNIKFVPVGTTYANAIVLTRGASFNTIKGNYFIGKPGTTNDLALIRSESPQNGDNLVTGNRFEDGSIAIWVKGTSSQIPLSRFHITGNVIEGFTSVGIKAEYVASMVIDGNTIVSAVTNAGQKDGIHLNFSVDTVKVTHNKIVLSGSTNTSGLQIQNCSAAAGLEGLIANNFISLLNGTTQTYGLRIIATTGQKVYYNSVYVNGTSNTGTRGINTVSTSSNIYVLNNNVESNYYPTLYEGASCARSNYNNFYSGTSLYGYHNGAYVNFTNLNDLKAATQKDTNSVSQIPYFNSNTDLHTFNGILNGLAIPVPEVTHDIDGQIRNTLTPDPGADEFDPPAIDVTVLGFTNPTGGCAKTATEPVTILIKNVGTDTVTSGLNGHFRFNNSATVVSESISATILPGDTLVYTFTATVNMDVSGFGGIDSTFTLDAWTTLTGDNVPYNDTANISVISNYTPPAPAVTTPVNIAYGAQANLVATSSNTIEWYLMDTSSVPVDTGSLFITPYLYDTTVYWVQARAGSVGSGGNIALNAVASHSGGGATTYGPANYNDNVIPAYGVLPWGWVSTNGWIEYTWPAPVSFNAVKFYKDNRPMSSCTFQYWNGSAYTDFLTYSSTVTDDSVNFPTVTSTKLRFNTVAGSSNPNFREIQVFEPKTSGCPSFRVQVQVNTALPPPVDAGVHAVVSPVGSTTSGTQTPIDVTLKNYGLDTLLSASIVWSLNSVIQDTILWTGTLPYNQTVTFTIDTAIFAGGTYCINAWSQLPNATADTVNTNDTASSCFNACMAGTYSIGPASTGTYSFNTFNSALSTLIASGICGHIVFEVYPGSYTEQLTIPQIAGMDANNTVTFRGSSNDSTLAILQYSAAAAADNWTLRLNGADFFRFERLTINALSPTYGRVIEMINGATYNVFAHNKLVSAGSSSSTTGCIYDYTTLNHYNTYLNNYMSGGYYTVYIYGVSTTSWQKGTVIQGNEIVGSYYYPMSVYYSDSVQIIGNKIHSGVAPYSYGMMVYYVNNQYRIVGNTINIVGTSASACYGIRDYYGNYVTYNANPTGYGLVANNMISIQGGTGVNYGLYSYYCNGTETYYNSVLITGTSTTGRALYQANTATNTLGQIYKNNIFANTGGGYAAYFTTPAQVTATDYNNFYSSASNLAYWGADMATLSALQAASGKDAHSVNINPPFNSFTDLHLSNTALSGLGIPVTAINVDFDGEPRSLLPTIGADEIPLLPIDAGVVAITSPGSPTNEGQQYPVTVTLANFGTDTLFTMPVQYTINNGAPVSAIYNDTLLSATTITFSLPAMTSPAGNATICAKTLLQGDSNTFNDEFCKTFFGTPLNDAMVTRIVGLEDGCNVGLDTISIWVKNIGVNAINSPAPSTVTASYKINPLATVVTQNFTPVIIPGDSVLFHFTTLADFVPGLADSLYNITAWIDLVGDNVSYNDTATAEVNSFHVPLPPTVTNVTIPYGTSTTLLAQSPDTLLWFASDTASAEIGQGNSFITPVLYTNTTYWVQAVNGSGGGGDLPELLYYNFDTPGTQVQNLATMPVGMNPAPITGSGLSIGGSGLFGSALQGTGVTSSGGVINTGWNTNLSGSFTIAFWTSNITPSATLWYIFGDAGATTFRCFTNGVASANNWMIRGGGLPDLTITGSATAAPNMVHAVLDASSGTFKGYVNGVLNATVSVPTVISMAGTGFQVGGYGTNSNLSGLMDEFRIYNRALTQAEILATYNVALGSGGCASIRVPVTVTVSNQATCDVGVSEIIQPVTATNLGAQETVKVRVINYGTLAQSNIPVSFKVDNLPVVTETFPGPIPPNDTADYTFVAKANLGVGGVTYQLQAWTGLVCDTTPQNDTAWKSVTNLLPTYCPSSATSALYQEISNVTVSTLNHTSPVTGAMYTNHSLTVPPTMLSPGVTYPMSITSSFAPSSSTQQSCWVKAWIDMNRDGVFDGTTEMVFSSATTSSNTVTANIQIPFTAMTGNTMMRVSLQQTTVANNVTPCNSYTYGETEDYMVTIAPQSACDAGVIEILQPGSTGQAGVAMPVWLKFMNFGSDTIQANTLSLAYSLNSGTPVVVAYPGSMLPGAIDSIQMPNITLPMGNNTLCAYTILACDSTLFNNEICKGVYGMYYTTLPYFDDFETGNLWYKPTASVNWQYGTPSASIIQSAYSGNKAWVTNLTGDYTNNADEYFYTPVFDFGGLGVTDTITLGFYHFLAFAASDYGMIQYNLNGGSGWANLGFVNDPSGINWYNTQVGGVHYFSQTNSGWMYSAYKLSPSTFNGMDTVQFRFRLYSNASGTSNGWAIDNFKLSLPQMPIDVGITSIDYPVNDTAMGSSVNASVTITNFGSNIQTMIPVLLKLNGTTVTTETWTGTLPSLGTAAYTFVLPFVVPSSSYQLCAETQLTGDAFPVNDSRCAGYQPLPAYHDVGVSTVVEPLPDSVGQICFYHAQAQPWYKFDVVVRLANYGQNAQTSIPVKYTFSTGGTQYSDVWTGNLAPGNTVDFTLNNQFLPALGAQQLCAETNLIGDPITTNNKACQSYTGVACIGIDDPGTDGFVLEQNIPNPSGSNTLIGYTVPQGGTVSFGLVDIVGQVLWSQTNTVMAGHHQIELDVTALAQGVYYYYIEFNGQRLTRKMVVRR